MMRRQTKVKDSILLVLGYLYLTKRILIGRGANRMPKNKREEPEVESRRDKAILKALNTPPKHHKDMKKGTRKKRQDDRPTASDKQS